MTGRERSRGQSLQNAELGQTRTGGGPGRLQVCDSIQVRIGDNLPPSIIYQYFVEHFGAIEIASFISGFAFIRMQNVSRAGLKILSDRPIEIAGHIIPVKQADYSNLPYKMYEHVKKRTTIPYPHVKQLILHLEDDASPKDFSNFVNEHCICKILERLSLVDLCSVAKTCKRLHEIAHLVFDQKYKNKSIDLNDFKRNSEKMTVLNIFGPSITSINLNNEIKGGLRDDVIGLLGQKCIKLKSLTLDGEFMENFVIDNHVELFGRLKELYIIRLGCLPLNQLLAVCPQLEKLKVTVPVREKNSKWDRKLDFTDVLLPNLVALRLEAIVSCKGIYQFSKRHRRIETFAMEVPCICCSNFHHGVNVAVYKILPNIRKITLRTNNSCSDEDESLRFNEMKNLKSVEIIFDHDPVAPTINKLFEQNALIEELQLRYATIDNDAVESICKIKTIKKIGFDDCTIDTKNLIRIIQTLPNLKKAFFDINSCSKATEFLDDILPILRSKGIEWFEEFGVASYDPKYDVAMMNMDKF